MTHCIKKTPRKKAEAETRRGIEATTPPENNNDARNNHDASYIDHNAPNNSDHDASNQPNKAAL